MSYLSRPEASAIAAPINRSKSLQQKCWLSEDCEGSRNLLACLLTKFPTTKGGVSARLCRPRFPMATPAGCVGKAPCDFARAGKPGWSILADRKSDMAESTTIQNSPVTSFPDRVPSPRQRNRSVELLNDLTEPSIIRVLTMPV